MSTPHPQDGRGLAWFAWGTVCLVWGTTFLAIKVALDTVPPFLMGGLRYVIAGVLLAAIVRLRKHRLPGPSQWGILAVQSLCMISIGNGGVVWAEQYLPSGLTSVLIATAPFWMTSVDALMQGGKQLFARQWLGLIVGFLGIVLLVWPDITAGGLAGRGFAIGVTSVQLGCAGWAFGSAYTRRHVLRGDVLGSAAVQMLFGGIFMTIAGTALGEWPRLGFSGTTTFALLYLIVPGSVIAFAAYSYALQRLDMAIVSLYTYVNPIIAVLLGTILLDEPFHPRTAVAIAVILSGVVIVNPPWRMGRT